MKGGQEQHSSNIYKARIRWDRAHINYFFHYLNMQSVIVLALLAVAVGAAQIDVTTTTPIPILRQEIQNENGVYKNTFETGHGIIVEENGSQKQVGALPEESGSIAKGSYSYTAPDGAVITVNWVADENGYRATGDHLPVAPPMPEHVVKQLADIAAAAAAAPAAAPAAA